MEEEINQLDASMWLCHAIYMYLELMERYNPTFIVELDHRLALYHLGGELDRIREGVEEERSNQRMNQRMMEGNE